MGVKPALKRRLASIPTYKGEIAFNYGNDGCDGFTPNFPLICLAPIIYNERKNTSSLKVATQSQTATIQLIVDELFIDKIILSILN